MDTRLLSIVGLLLVIFIAAMLAKNGIVGYSAPGSLKEYPYEGFAQIKEKFEARDESGKKQFASVDAFSLMGEYNKIVSSLSPVTSPVTTEAFGAMNSTTSLNSTPEDASPALKVVGFKGVQSGAYGNEKIIGFMYNNESNTTCKPYGYTNSKGNICLSPEDIKMLTTRGGNALGASDQIGK